MSENINLISSISLKPISMPVRSPICRHFCEYLEFSEIINTRLENEMLKCYICG